MVQAARPNSFGPSAKAALGAEPSRFQGAPREAGAENGGFYRVPEFSGFDGLFGVGRRES